MTAAEHDLLTEIRERRATFLRAGAIAAAIGTPVYVVALLLHGDLPDQTTESLLTFIAPRPWAFHHLVIELCFLLWLTALSGLAHSLTDSRAWVLGRLAQTAGVLGMAVLLWHYNLDGPALEQVADAWVAADGADKAVHLERGTILTIATSGMFPLYVALLLGLPFLLTGLAVVADDGYPSWLGWVAVSGGGLSLLVGTTNYVGLDLLPIELFMISVLVLSCWMLAMSRLMWRRASALRTTSAR